jgi:maleylpyruvate isomerase
MLDHATNLFLTTVDSLPDTDLDKPTPLPGWSRRHLLAHVASNAQALGRLVNWARTGVRTPMYSSAEQRNADIEAGARRSPDSLRAAVHSSAAQLAEQFRDLPDEAWSAEVVTAQGRTVPATEILWMRTREVAIHTVDLDVGVDFADLPEGFCLALVSDIARWRSGQGPAMTGPAMALSDGTRTWTVPGVGDPVQVMLTTPQLAAWLSGRSQPAGLPELPKWL